jgi:16S rRNA processing protein RimM
MNFICIGRIVNTHALKGEIRIISNFEYKEKVFKKGFDLYIGQFKNKEVIETYRVHKQFDMVKFVGIDYINDVIKYKGCDVYVSESDLSLNENEILESEFYGMKVYSNNEEVGIITEYRNDNGNKMIRVNDKFIPYNKDFIERIDKQNNAIYMHNIEVFL